MDGPVVLTDDLKELLVRLDGGSSSGGQAETEPAEGGEMRSREAGDLGAGGQCADSPGAENLRTEIPGADS